MSAKIKRCPRGSRRNKITGDCDKNKVVLKSVPVSDAPHQRVEKQKRCPRGSRRNKKTGICEPTEVTSKSNKTHQDDINKFKKEILDMIESGKNIRNINYDESWDTSKFAISALFHKYQAREKCRIHRIQLSDNEIMYEYVAKTVASQLKDCIKRGLTVLPMIVSYEISGDIEHANSMVLKADERKIYYFEPNGVFFSGWEKIVASFLNILTSEMSGDGNTYTYEFVQVVCNAGLQKKELEIRRRDKDVNANGRILGYCQMWSIYFFDCVLSYPNLPINRIQDIIFDTAKGTTGIRDLITEYIRVTLKNIHKYLKDRGIKNAEKYNFSNLHELRYHKNITPPTSASYSDS